MGSASQPVDSNVRPAENEVWYIVKIANPKCDDLDVIPSNWLVDKTKCHYPPAMAKYRAKRRLISQDWEIMNIKTTSKPYCDYDSAMTDCIRLLSGKNTQSASDAEPKGLGCRKKKITHVFSPQASPVKKKGKKGSAPLTDQILQRENNISQKKSGKLVFPTPPSLGKPAPKSSLSPSILEEYKAPKKQLFSVDIFDGCKEDLFIKPSCNNKLKTGKCGQMEKPAPKCTPASSTQKENKAPKKQSFSVDLFDGCEEDLLINPSCNNKLKTGKCGQKEKPAPKSTPSPSILKENKAPKKQSFSVDLFDGCEEDLLINPSCNKLKSGKSGQKEKPSGDDNPVNKGSDYACSIRHKLIPCANPSGDPTLADMALTICAIAKQVESLTRMMGNMQTDVNILATQEPMKEKKKSSSKEVFDALPFSDFEKLIEFDDKIRADSKLSEKLVSYLYKEVDKSAVSKMARDVVRSIITPELYPKINLHGKGDSNKEGWTEFHMFQVQQSVVSKKFGESDLVMKQLKATTGLLLVQEAGKFLKKLSLRPASTPLNDILQSAPTPLDEIMQPVNVSDDEESEVLSDSTPVPSENDFLSDPDDDTCFVEGEIA
nr:PREDICTED: uncharacterized protein LOC109032584 isoform X2 [Bemisia tabaci]